MGRPRLTSVATWWHELSGVSKFRLYSRITLQMGLAVIAAAMAVTADSWWSVAGIVVAGIAAIAVVEERPEFALSPSALSRQWMLPAAVVTLTSVWLAYATVARLSPNESVLDRTRPTGICVAVLAMFSVVPFIRYRWWTVFGLSLITGFVYSSSLRAGIGTVAVTFVLGGFVVGTTLLTVWGLQVVEDLDRAKVVDAELQVAEERLRFARDLHDIVGRSFSAIAVKSELAVVLSRSGDVDRAMTEMDEVRTLAVESMGQMRALVRGYRGIDLKGEVAGARSLLSAVGCRLSVEGDPAAVPAQFCEVADTRV